MEPNCWIGVEVQHPWFCGALLSASLCFLCQRLAGLYLALSTFFAVMPVCGLTVDVAGASICAA